MPTVKATDRRVQFDILPERLTELDQVMVFCDLKTRKDLFDNAMTLLEWAVQEVIEGRKIASYDQEADDVQVVRFPVLDNAARKAKAYKRVDLVDTAGHGMNNPEEVAKTQGRKAEAREPHLILATTD